MQARRILVIGGYGFFGQRLVRRLARIDTLDVVVAGRSLQQAQALVAALAPTAAAQLSALAVDALSDQLSALLQRLRPQVVVHTSGPFQGQGYAVARACIACGVHYVDLADGHDFVCGIGALDEAARAAGVLVASGASSVPALSSAAVDHLVEGWQRVDFIDIGISPGNRTERGLSTVQAILAYCGRPLAGTAPPAHGWSGTWRFDYPGPVGRRLLSPCEVPDPSLLPARYPGHPQLRFGAGLELRWLHRGMNLMAAMARVGLVRDWRRHAGWLKAAADWARHLGSDAGAMHVAVRGVDAAGAAGERCWVLLAEHGDGPYVPTLAASALVRRLMAGELPARGARPCVGLLTLADFEREAAGLAIRMQVMEER
ncbi:MAG: hypothetical protein EPO12_09690 [Aquabacterium sp.]|nr:MAG: hypothetical protein EPO12_09690 [Aquabacterium sp.]